MNILFRYWVLCALLTAVAWTQAERPRSHQTEPDVRLPSGTSQREELLKAEHEKSVQEATQLLDLAESLKQDLEKNDRHVLSVSTLKKTEKIERLAKRIRSRLRRF